jgi:hypothetical protein
MARLAVAAAEAARKSRRLVLGEVFRSDMEVFSSGEGGKLIFYSAGVLPDTLGTFISR